ncbi:TetR/AcrR family transcriptional regulator [Hyphomicrobium sp.]|uniref:TetR/AcrR family transcriptional regulator n=1 Tax=Hyphomicrobium sp. TaxID=82 RepID=UPI00132783C5|nr:TetR/AcrR family transcriptional regulator [Hyphomicrobium sp.]KAB2937158.1 MAG: TetR/AcrR family transcriptional regulator [Hyphomicrobium sp.]
MSTRPRGDKVPPRWHRRADARPDELLSAALEVFGERGFAGARLEDVAQRAGVTKGTIYLYFDSKETLFREVVRAGVGAAVASGEQFVRDYQGPTAELLATFMRRLWEAMRDPANARLARLASSELGSFPDLLRMYMDEVVLRTRRSISAIVERGVTRGEFRAVSPVLAGRMVQALCVHVAQAQGFIGAFDRDKASDEQVVDAVVDLVMHGVLATPIADKCPRTHIIKSPRRRRQ